MSLVLLWVQGLLWEVYLEVRQPGGPNLFVYNISGYNLHIIHPVGAGFHLGNIIEWKGLILGSAAWSPVLGLPS